MTPPVWQATCSYCKATFPLAEQETHREACEARGRAEFATHVERPKSWGIGSTMVREYYVPQANGPAQRRFYVAIAENPLTRAQLVGLRDLITLALDEAPEPLAVVPAAPVPPASSVT